MSNPIQVKVDQFDMPHPSSTGLFQISVVRHPHLTDGDRAVPVLFVLDADMVFALAAEIARLRGTGNMLPTVMVVGVGYGAAFADMAKLRTADLTPPLSEAGKQSMGDLASLIGDKDGGAEAFLTFLTKTLAPEIERRYPETSPSERILFGHSLGGLFTSYALLTRPHAFSAFLCSSPSLWWDQFAILSHLPVFAGKLAGLKSKPRVMISVGSKEQDLPTKVPPGLDMPLEAVQAMVAASRMVDGAADFVSALRESGLKDTTYVAFDGEDHATVIAAAIMRGLVVAVPAPA
jgi:predicted alpha/beta superfamily hydrolase